MRVLAYENRCDSEPYRGLNGAFASVCTLFFTGKHSWEKFGSFLNYYAITHDTENERGRLFTDSVLLAYRQNIIQTFGPRGVPDFYGVRAPTAGSSAEIGDVVYRAIYLMSYTVAPIHRNWAKEGSCEINNRLITEGTRSVTLIYIS